MAVFPLEGVGAAAEEEEDDGFAGGVEGLEEAALVLGEGDFAEAGGFAGHVEGFAEGDEEDVGLGGGLEGLEDEVFGGGGVEGEGGFVGVELFDEVGVLDEVAAEGVGVGVGGVFLLDGFEEGEGELAVAGAPPVADEVGFAFDLGADEGDFGAGVEGEEVVGVFEEDDAFLGGFLGEGEVVGGEDAGGGAGVDVAVGVGEEAEAVFGLEDAAAGGVEGVGADAVFLDEAGGVGGDVFADHVHVAPGVEGVGGGGGGVAEAVVGHFHDAGVVGDGEAGEAPVAPEEGGEEPGVAGGGDAVDLIEGGHDAADAGLDGGVVGGEVFVVHAGAAHVDGVVVAAGFAGAVEGEVFEAGEGGVGAGEVVLLDAADHGFGDAGAEPGVFA